MNADPWKEYRRRRRMLLWAALAGLALFAACFRLAQVRHAARSSATNRRLAGSGAVSRSASNFRTAAGKRPASMSARASA